MYIIQSNRNLPQFGNYSQKYFNEKLGSKPSKYNIQNSRERLSNLRDEQQINEDDKEFERLRRQINVNTKNKVTEILNTAKEGDHKIFDKLIDEIEDKALEQQKKFHLKSLNSSTDKEDK